MQKLRIIVGGYIGLFPTGGVTWDYIQYPLGLRELGHDVFYLEDTAQFPKYQSPGKDWDDASDSIKYLRDQMESFGMPDRWAYRDVASGSTFGMSRTRLKEICRTADVFINISLSTYLRDEYLSIPVRILIDSDPMFTQVDYYNALQNGDPTDDRYKIGYLVNNHTHLFTFGENIGAAECRVPTLGFNWKPTRQPIVLSAWRDGIRRMPDRRRITSVMNWSVRDELRYDGEAWGQKDKEFIKIERAPLHFRDASFEISVARIPAVVRRNLIELGWSFSNALECVSTPHKYKSFIEGSLAEFGVAKETYVKSRSGWFSGRSACYLAAGRPVVAQDTGWSNFIGSGSGLLSFHDHDSAVDALGRVLREPQLHAAAAIEVSQQFDSREVLSKMLQELS